MARSPKSGRQRWRRRKAARPAEILDAALACFVERGFAATRLDDVARRAGVTKGTVYLYFRSKQDLFRAVVEELVVPEVARAEREVRAYRGSSADLLRRAGARLVADGGSEPSARHSEADDCRVGKLSGAGALFRRPCRAARAAGVRRRAAARHARRRVPPLQRRIRRARAGRALGVRGHLGGFAGGVRQALPHAALPGRPSGPVSERPRRGYAAKAVGGEARHCPGCWPWRWRRRRRCRVPKTC
jgi:AcrR family transcriptional regulator